ncbi:DUF3857 domain-containing protein [Verrucomicrobiaceae bacterium N1E253]|uniref:DUF3857 domain-containing protein n=1 Tax=Oceaniferula marina TaxID=2748318 RepID=A0A851GBB3_9BACT|nr:DUF3857 domain-containing protein [Oceaniferula marina]NWK54242.1 DUF3857 domain-containing protein [Oceaniferula marina]
MTSSDFGYSDAHASTSSLKGSKVTVTQSPSWLQAVEYSPMDRVLDAPVSIHLIDHQINTLEHSAYYRSCKRLETPAGVQDESQIEVAFDPAIQKLELHHLSVFRHGELVANYADLDKIRLIQRETSLEQRIYGGEITALIVLDDVRSGDTVDLAYTITNESWLFNQHEWRHFLLQHRNTVGLLRLVWLGEKPRYSLNVDKAEDVSFQESDGCFIWQRRDCPAFKMENGIPLNYMPIEDLELSSFANWGEVQDEVNALWRNLGQLAPEALQMVEQIKAECSETELIEKLVQWVRQEIRYQGFEVGALAMKPADLEAIWKRRHGDCKEKSSLLVALLRAAGVEAYPALVHTSMGGLLESTLPSPGAFNHAIVCIRHQGLEYWVDSTNSLQRGGLPNWTGIYHFGYALLIGPDDGNLSVIAEPDKRRNWVQIAEHYQINSHQKSAKFTIKHRASGVEAEHLRHIVEHEGRVKLQGDFVAWVKAAHPSAELQTDLEIESTDSKDQFCMQGEFYIPEAFIVSPDGSEEGVVFSPYAIIDRVVGADHSNRKHPLGLNYPCRIGQTTTIDCDVSIPFSKDTKRVDCPFFVMSFDVENHEGKPLLRYHYETKEKLVPPDRMAGYKAHLVKSEDLITWAISGPRNASGQSEVENAWGAPKRQSYRSSGSGRRRVYRERPESSSAGIPVWPFVIAVVIVLRLVFAMMDG